MDIKESVRRLADKGEILRPILCEVIEINDDSTIDVRPLAAPEIYGVRVNAAIAPESGIVSVPAIGSKVFILPLNDWDAFVLASSELESHTVTVGDVEVVQDDESHTVTIGNAEHTLTGDGLKLTVGSNDLKTGLQDLQTALEQLTVNTPNGPSSIPINVAAITAAFSKILGTLQ